jgi:hypothetical protein
LEEGIVLPERKLAGKIYSKSVFYVSQWKPEKGVLYEQLSLIYRLIVYTLFINGENEVALYRQFNMDGRTWTNTYIYV